jgi:hypothetical protein
VENFEQILVGIVSSISTLSLLGVVAFLMRSWLLARLKASIKHEYDLKKLEIEHEREIRLKGEIVAELLAEWIRKGGNLDYHQLNKLSFQAFVWLPRELAEELSNSLSHQNDRKDLRVLIKNIRTYLQGEDDGFSAKDIIVFDEPDPQTYGSPTTSWVTSYANTKPKPWR